MLTSCSHCLFFLSYAKRNTFFSRYFNTDFKLIIDVRKPSCFLHSKTFFASLELGLGLHYPRIVCSDRLTS